MNQSTAKPKRNAFEDIANSHTVRTTTSSTTHTKTPTFSHQALGLR